MEPESVAVVSFAVPKDAAALSTCLNRIGLSSLTLPVSALHRAGIPPSTNGLVLLIEPERADRERLLSALDDLGEWPSLVLLSGDGRERWDRDLLTTCWDFALWPCPADELSFRVRRLQQSSVSQATLAAPLAEALARVNLIGRSPAFVEVIRRLERVVERDVPVLIEGETGTGKELVARAVHYLSGRCDGPFVPVNCGALPDNLVENELFGHERGAYTDAIGTAKGAVGEAAGGTLFLDEVETLTHKAQAALLRFLSDNEVRPLGARSTHQANVRIVAASNRNLQEMCAQGSFRTDLFFRLNVLPLLLPPLRERTDDIEPLARHFTAHYCRQHGLPRKTLARLAVSRLRAYHWPGNIRELQNLIHRSVLMTDAAVLNPDPCLGSLRSHDHAVDDLQARADTFGAAKAAAIERFERSYLTALMDAAEGNVTKAARMAGKERRALGKLLKKYAIANSCKASSPAEPLNQSA